MQLLVQRPIDSAARTADDSRRVLLEMMQACSRQCELLVRSYLDVCPLKLRARPLISPSDGAVRLAGIEHLVVRRTEPLLAYAYVARE